MSISDFNWLDVVLISVTIGSMVSSIRAGLTREVIRLASAVLAVVLGVWFYGSAGAFLTPYVSSRGVSNFGGFLLVFFGVLIAGSLVSFVLGRLLKLVGLSWFDRVMGAMFGLARGVLVSIAVVMALLAFAPGAQGASPPGAIVHSRVAPYMVEAARVMAAIAPRELKDEFSKRHEQLKHVWKEAVRKGTAQTGNEGKL